jgi:simple sugar transport system permease protein
MCCLHYAFALARYVDEGGGLMEAYALVAMAATLNAGTVLALAALGLLINEKAGIVNLGAEGMMLCAAIAGFATVVHTGSDVLGFAAGMAAGALMAAVLWRVGDLAQHQPIRHRVGAQFVWCGFFGVCGHQLCAGQIARAHASSRCLVWRTFPSSAQPCSNSTRMVYGVIVFTLALIWLFVANSCRLGVARGRRVTRIGPCAWVMRCRPHSLVRGGRRWCLVRLGRVPISLSIYTPLWVEGMIAGKGWIALALTTFGTWRPARVLMGAYLFGGVTMLQFHLQATGMEVPSQFLSMLPYLATIVVLALISRNPAVDSGQHAGLAG